MKSFEKKLDRAFQNLKIDKNCHYCSKPATAIHHIIGRENKVYRWDRRNAMPVCQECHILGIHGGKIEKPTIDLPRIGLKEYLMREGLIFDEFLQIKKKEFRI